MKKTIFITGLVSANLVLFGALLKALHLYGAGILLTISIPLFCFGFLPFALYSNYRNQEERKYKWLYIVTFIVFSFDLVGALFKIQHWPGSGEFLLIGLPLPFVLFLPVYLYQTYKFKEKSVLNNLSVMFGLTFLAVFSVLLALNSSSSTLDSFVLNSFNNENSAKFNQAIAKNQTEKDNIKQKSDELCAFIDDLKYDVLIASDNKQFQKNSFSNEFNPLLTNNRNSTNQIILMPIAGQEMRRVDLLKSKLKDFNGLIAASEKADNDLKNLANSLFDVSDKKIQNNNDIQKWEEIEFQSMNLVMVLETLSRLESNVRFVETEYLSLR